MADCVACFENGLRDEVGSIGLNFKCWVRNPLDRREKYLEVIARTNCKNFHGKYRPTRNDSSYYEFSSLEHPSEVSSMVRFKFKSVITNRSRVHGSL